MKTTYIILMFCLCSMCSCVSTVKKVEPKEIKARITAYHCKEKDHLKYKTKNAVGTNLKKGQIATNWAQIPVGTIVEFNKQKFEVTDYGSALCSGKYDIPTIDLYVFNNYEMKQWGVRYFDDVHIIKWGSYEQSAKILKDRLKYWHCRQMYNEIQNKL